MIDEFLVWCARDRGRSVNTIARYRITLASADDACGDLIAADVADGSLSRLDMATTSLGRSPRLFFTVNANSTFFTRGGVGVTHPQTGVYTLTFNRSVADCAISVTPVAEVVTGSASSGAVEVEDDDEVDGVEAGVDGSAGAGGAAPAARRWATSGVTDNVRGIEGWPVATSVRVAMPSSTASGRGAAGAARRSVASVPDRISARSATDAGSSSSSLSGPRRR